MKIYDSTAQYPTHLFYTKRNYRSSNLKRISFVFRERFSVEFIHHLHHTDDGFLAVEYRNTQQTLDYESVFLGNLRTMAQYY